MADVALVDFDVSPGGTLRPLPNDTEVAFTLSDGPARHVVYVRLQGNRIYVNASSGNVFVLPQASNALLIEARREW